MSQPNPTFEEEDLSALIDGELSPAERSALEARLSADPALQAEYDALADARAFFGANGGVSAPADLLADILVAVDSIDDDESNVVQLAPWYKKPLGIPVAGWAVAAAAMLVVYVALPGFNGGAEPTRTNAAARAPGPELSKKTQLSDNIAPQSSIGSLSTKADANEPLTQPANGDAVAVVETKAPLPSKQDLDAPNSYGLSKPSTKATLKGSKDKLHDSKLIKKLLVDKTAPPPSKQPFKGFAQVPYQYTLYTDDTQALMQLAAIAGRYRGELAGPNDSPLELEELHGTEAATVIVKIPAHALRDFGQAIEGLGNVYSSADNTMFAGDPVEVRVRVQLAAGQVGTGDAPPAAQKLRNKAETSADELLEVDQAL